MKRVNLPLSRLSLAEKLDLMETLWADLSRNEKVYQSPVWHESVLRDREKAFKSGKATVSEWGKAKEKIRKKFS